MGTNKPILTICFRKFEKTCKNIKTFEHNLQKFITFGIYQPFVCGAKSKLN